MRSLALGAAVVLVTLGLGCTPREKSAAGFRLPDGDAAQGKAVYAALRCGACHRVAGEENMEALPAAESRILLGGPVPYTRTDGELVTAIINPSHELAKGYRRELVTFGGKSRMRDYGDALTPRQLADLVAYLHTRYEVVRPQPRY